MADINQEGFVVYYDSATNNRNQQYYQTIYSCMDLVHNKMYAEFRADRFNRLSWIHNNLPWYKKTLKATLMTNGVPVKTADSIVRYLGKWLTTAC